MTERTGVLAAVLSSALGGVAAAATRFVIGGTDPVTLGALRFGLGFLFLLPIALARPRRWPRGRDWSAVLALYGSRSDKDWSLTDCISFVVMKHQGLQQALTTDLPFLQAGFQALLRD